MPKKKPKKEKLNPNFVEHGRVRDKFKLPRAGDLTLTGTLILLTKNEYTVKMDDGKLRSGTPRQLEVLFEPMF